MGLTEIFMNCGTGEQDFCEQRLPSQNEARSVYTYLCPSNRAKCVEMYGVSQFWSLAQYLRVNDGGKALDALRAFLRSVEGDRASQGAPDRLPSYSMRSTR